VRLIALLSALAAAFALAELAAAADRGTLTVHTSRYGSILVDGHGFALYGFTRDAKGRSACSGPCAAVWPPYLAREPKPGVGAKPLLLGTIRRSDGSLQGTYAGRPLYYSIGDRSPGQILCQDVEEYGGVWVVVRADGRLVR
jgi:predicted lipoprotein with Yx(FWY)xxD motif